MGIFDKKKTEDKEEKKVKKASDVQDEKKNESMKNLYNESEEKKTVSKSETKRKKTGNAYGVLVKPLITEKAANLGVSNKYVFVVKNNANKIEITKAIEEVYGIKPIAINIVKMQGKIVRSGKTSGRRKDWKKAIVTLPEGKTIKVYEGV